MIARVVGRPTGVRLKRVPGYKWSWLLLRLPPLRSIRQLAEQSNVPALVAHLTTVIDREPMTVFRRAAAATALGRLNATEAIEPLAWSLRATEAYGVRASAAVALCRIGGLRAAHALTGVINDKPFAIRQAAVEAIGNSGDPALAQHLFEVLANPNHHWILRASAAEGLGKIATAEAIDALGDCLLQRSHPLVAVAATTALTEAKTPTAESTLRAVSKTATSFRRRQRARSALRARRRRR